MFAGYNYLFKLFFLHLFFALKIYNKTFNTKIAIGSAHFFKIQAFEWTAYIKSWKFREVCLMFIPVIHIYPEQEYIMNVLKDILFLCGRLYV